jgi:hypothetical protein
MTNGSTELKLQLQNQNNNNNNNNVYINVLDIPSNVYNVYKVIKIETWAKEETHRLFKYMLLSFKSFLPLLFSTVPMSMRMKLINVKRWNVLTFTHRLTQLG